MNTAPADDERIGVERRQSRGVERDEDDPRVPVGVVVTGAQELRPEGRKAALAQEVELLASCMVAAGGQVGSTKGTRLENAPRWRTLRHSRTAFRDEIEGQRIMLADSAQEAAPIHARSATSRHHASPGSRARRVSITGCIEVGQYHTPLADLLARARQHRAAPRR
jgi:hypothetical protein